MRFELHADEFFAYNSTHVSWRPIRTLLARKIAVTMDRYLFTSESVSMGHPDKVADQISDAVLDHCLATDPTSRVACETLVTTDRVVVAGEITTRADVSPAVVDRVSRDVIREIGYTDPSVNFAADTYK